MRAESGPEARRHARSGSGAGCGGMIARLSKEVVLSGELSHIIDRSNARNGTIDISIYGTIILDGFELNGAKLMMLVVIIPQDYGDVEIVPIYCDELFPPLMPIRKFREILVKYLNKLIELKNVTGIEQRGVEKYLSEDLAQYSEASIKFEEAMQAMAEIRRDLSNPENVRKLDQVLSTLEVESACDSNLVVE